MNSGAIAFRGQPYDHDGPVFREPWEAQAFAMTLALHQQGLFTWSEWMQALTSQIALAHSSGAADQGDDYYRHWLTALEALIETKGASSIEELMRYRRAWDRASDRTAWAADRASTPGLRRLAPVWQVDP